ncbi:hypothetical protein BaRGS_00000868, partial [Batillaria attramentaria]
MYNRGGHRGAIHRTPQRQPPPKDPSTVMFRSSVRHAGPPAPHNHHHRHMHAAAARGQATLNHVAAQPNQVHTTEAQQLPLGPFGVPILPDQSLAAQRSLGISRPSLPAVREETPERQLTQNGSHASGAARHPTAAGSAQQGGGFPLAGQQSAAVAPSQENRTSPSLNGVIQDPSVVTWSLAMSTAGGSFQNPDGSAIVRKEPAANVEVHAHRPSGGVQQEFYQHNAQMSHPQHDNEQQLALMTKQQYSANHSIFEQYLQNCWQNPAHNLQNPGQYQQHGVYWAYNMHVPQHSAQVQQELAQQFAQYSNPGPYLQDLQQYPPQLHGPHLQNSQQHQIPNGAAVYDGRARSTGTDWVAETPNSASVSGKVFNFPNASDSEPGTSLHAPGQTGCPPNQSGAAPEPLTLLTPPPTGDSVAIAASKDGRSVAEEGLSRVEGSLSKLNINASPFTPSSKSNAEKGCSDFGREQQQGNLPLLQQQGRQKNVKRPKQQQQNQPQVQQQGRRQQPKLEEQQPLEQPQVRQQGRRQQPNPEEQQWQNQPRVQQHGRRKQPKAEGQQQQNQPQVQQQGRHQHPNPEDQQQQNQPQVQQQERHRQPNPEEQQQQNQPHVQQQERHRQPNPEEQQQQNQPHVQQQGGHQQPKPQDQPGLHNAEDFSQTYDHDVDRLWQDFESNGKPSEDLTWEFLAQNGRAFINSTRFGSSGAGWEAPGAYLSDQLPEGWDIWEDEDLKQL